MKKFILFIFVVAALVSCNKADDPKSAPVVAGEDATVSISLVGTEKALDRSSAAIPAQAADNTINNITVFIFNSASKNLDRMKVATAQEITDKKVVVNATAGDRDIYVIANVPSASTSALANVITENDLKAVTSDLKYENEGSFVMTGKQNATLNPASAGTTDVPITVSRLVSRIILDEITAQFTGGLAGSSLQVDSVYLLKAVGTKSYADPTYVVTPPTSYTRNGTVLAFPIHDVFTTPVAVSNSTAFKTSQTNGVHYYTYANPETTFGPATKLIVTGMLNGTRTYYPVAINVAGNGYTPTGTPGIAGNTQYKITMVVKGYGTTDPNTQLQPATCQIIVTPQNWNTIINQNVEY